jgi:hypothetical protein
MTRAHLVAAAALAARNQWGQAAALVLHPLGEFFSGDDLQLGDLGLEGFKNELLDLAQSANDPTRRDEFSNSEIRLRGRLDRAIDGVELSDPGEIGSVMSTLLRAAEHGYVEAYSTADPEPAEYLEARALVRSAGALLEARASTLRSGNVAGFDSARSQVAELAEALGPAYPPVEPALEPGMFSAMVSRVEFSLSGL